MNIVCVICSDLLTPSDDVFHTPCGHVFHYACLLQWLERSKTCPQCRIRTTNQTIHRIYFNFPNNDSIVEDATFLQMKIDNLNFQLKLKDENLNTLTEECDKLKKQTAGLRQKVHEVESEVNSKNSAIHALKEQIKFYKQQCSDVDNVRKENEELEKKVKHLKSIQNLIDSSKPKLADIILQTNDASKLITYIGVLKGELDSMHEKTKEFKEKYKDLIQKFSRVSKENKFFAQKCAKQKELEKQLMLCEKQLMLCESEKISLQTQLLDMQTNTHKCVCNKISVEKQESLKAQEELCIKESRMTINESRSKLKKDDSCIIIDPDSTENIPQSIKSQGFFSMRDHSMKRQISSNNLKVPLILAKKSRINQLSQKTVSGSGMSFDGFGGHAKYDKFPNPISSSHIKRTREDSKSNKPKFDTSNNQKISDLLMLSNNIII